MTTVASAWNQEIHPGPAVTAWAKTPSLPTSPLSTAPLTAPLSATVLTPARPAVDDSAVSSLVGRNLRHLRKQHRFSLEELSSQCGVSRAMLGQIEQGKSIPSIKTLWQVAQALGVSVSWFVETSHEAPVVRIAVSPDSHATLGSGEGELRSLQQAGDGAIDAFYELRLAPGAVLSLPAPPVSHRINVTVSQGALSAVVDDTPYLIQTREALQYEGKQVLTWRNDGEVTAQAYVVVRSLLRG